jgi:FHS family L-fucose permease-like MFS transporter
MYELHIRHTLTSCSYFAEARPDLSVTEGHHEGANFYAIAQALFAVGRFAAAGLMYYGGKPRYVLLAFQSLIMVFISAAIVRPLIH